MPTPRKRLGKGLSALLGEQAVESTLTGSGVAQVPVSRITPNRYQPRRTFEPEALADLAASIAQKGVLQPLIVTEGRDGGWELVSGERRWRAAQQAGLPTVPVIVREVDDRDLLEIALIENLQREDLDAIEEATGYRRLIDDFGATQAELAEHLGRSRPAVSNALRLLDLPDQIQAMVRQGRLTAGHGRALLGLENRRRMPELAREAADRGLSVRQLERRVKRENGGPRRAAEPSKSGELERQRIEEDLQRALGTRVAVRTTSRGKGRIEISFYSLDDFEGLVERLLAARP
ncbi:MAG: ParB/RepB/Spo0J family partition protein [Gemmatimonadota bacterium]